MTRFPRLVRMARVGASVIAHGQHRVMSRQQRAQRCDRGVTRTLMPARLSEPLLVRPYEELVSSEGVVLSVMTTTAMNRCAGSRCRVTRTQIPLCARTPAGVSRVMSDKGPTNFGSTTFFPFGGGHRRPRTASIRRPPPLRPAHHPPRPASILASLRRVAPDRPQPVLGVHPFEPAQEQLLQRDAEVNCQMVRASRFLRQNVQNREMRQSDAFVR